MKGVCWYVGWRFVDADRGEVLTPCAFPLLKIADFGVAFQFETDNDDRVRNMKGTPSFMAPEMCAGNGAFSGRLADIWSVGVSLYMFVYGCLPFTGVTKYAQWESIINEEVKFPDGTDGVDDNLKDLIRSLLAKNPGEHTWQCRS